MAGVSAPALVSLRNILVAIDFSPCSQLALRCAAALAQPARSKIFLAHVIPLEPMSPIPMDAAPGYWGMAAKDPLLLMQQAAAALGEIEHTTLVEHGEFWPALNTMLADNEIELIVMGTHGREGLKKLVLGSVAEEVFRRAACPVVTVGPHVTPECLAPGQLRRIVFATDLSAASMHALPYVTMLAKQHQARLTFLHVLASAVPDAEFVPTTFVDREIDDARLELQDMVPSGVQADVVVEVGMTAELIVRVAQAQNASLIVMGLHAQSVFAATHLPWSTAHRVVCDAHCPVMTVR